MTYAVVIKRSAERELKALPAEVSSRIAARLRTLADDPRPDGAIRLKGSANYRLRVGDYRIIYSVDDNLLVVTIIAAGHRRDVYREL